MQVASCEFGVFSFQFSENGQFSWGSGDRSKLGLRVWRFPNVDFSMFAGDMATRWQSVVHHDSKSTYVDQQIERIGFIVLFAT